MKTILIGTLNKSINNPFIMYTEKNKNSLLIYKEDEKKYYFNSHYNSVSEEILMDSFIFKFDTEETFKESYKVLENIINSSFEMAETLSEEPLEKNKESYPRIKGIMNNLIFKYSYKDDPDLFDFCSELFIKLLMDHPLINGNKRFALSYLINLLRYFGFHFWFSKGFLKDYKHYENKIINFIEKLSSSESDNPNKIKEISNWIEDYCVIAIEFREKNDLLINEGTRILSRNEMKKVLEKEDDEIIKKLFKSLSKK